MLLDEPSAHLDAESEAVLLRTLRRLAEQSLVVVVAHRDTVVAAADRVVEVAAPVRGADAEPAAAIDAPARAVVAPPPSSSTTSRPATGCAPASCSGRSRWPRASPSPPPRRG
ncbi:hypothetical protein [Nocardioides daphniae]|uniref:hypothetical protein n=1 Tax=Nocardioides daphniae TaxID=402297 RepID=UPI0019310486|nr:hypothetical protein [Nocardioides daphniae]